MVHKGNGPAQKGYRAKGQKAKRPKGQKAGLMQHYVLRLHQESILDILPVLPRCRQDVSAPA